MLEKNKLALLIHQSIMEHTINVLVTWQSQFGKN